MNLQSSCLTCLIGQIEKAYNNLGMPYTNDEMVRVQKKIMTKLGKIKEKSMPYYSQVVYQTIAEEMRIIDPYHQIKHASNQLALSLVPTLQKLIQQSKNPLLTAIVVAIMGNTIDFGTSHNIDVVKDVQEFSLDKLKINHFEEFRKDFKEAQKIMIIGDNAGEVVFDKVMMEYIHKYYPTKELVYAVRGGPAINDITIDDVKDLELEKICTVVEGSACPGVIMKEVSPEFSQSFEAADLILSKGQGNYESLDDVHLATGKMYFLLKAKCRVIAQIFKVPIGSLILFLRN